MSHPRSISYPIHVLLVFITVEAMRKYSKKSWQTLLNQPRTELPKVLCPPRSTRIHFCFPLSINHQRFLIHQGKEKTRKEQPKKEQTTRLTVLTTVTKKKQRWKRKFFNHSRRALIQTATRLQSL